MIQHYKVNVTVFAAAVSLMTATTWAAESSRYHSDSNARYQHHIDLYDAGNRKLTPESTKPYSPLNTCGRCHDYETIAHGWHFSAFRSDDDRVDDGRASEPWIWTDERTGTQLPLSPRHHPKRFDPAQVGLSSFEMVRQFGGRMPGTTAVPKLADSKAPSSTPNEPVSDADADNIESRWTLSGALEVDCMICHAVAGAYDFQSRREAVEAENFAWAATAGLRLGAVKGDVSRIKTGSDPDDPKVQAKFPQVTYDTGRFSQDGTVHFDLVREPADNACYQCHSQRWVNDDGIEQRWLHDQDIHLRAGMNCVDCHRNGIDHDIVRGFEGQDHVSGAAIGTLSCKGCHLGTEIDQETATAMDLPGRLGSPEPLHEGLPPLHFDKLSCTACHSGPSPASVSKHLMTSLSHGLGEKGHRTGREWPTIQGPIFAAVENQDKSSPDERVFPQRAFWPAYFAQLEDGELTPLSPESVYDWTRRALRVRKSFESEVTGAKLSRKDRDSVLGEDSKLGDDELEPSQLELLQQRKVEIGRDLFDDKVHAALEAIQSQDTVKRAAYVSAGMVFVTRDSATLAGDGVDVVLDPSTPEAIFEKLVRVADDRLETDIDQKIGMLSWPMAHNVRGAGRALGVKGCVECHGDTGYVFTSTVTPSGPAPVVTAPITMASLQGVSEDQRLRWNQLFEGRATFKYVIAGSLLAVFLAVIVGLAQKVAAASASSKS